MRHRLEGQSLAALASLARTQEIAGSLPEGTYSPTPTIADRDFWALVGKSKNYESVVADAEKLAAGPVDATRMTKRALNHWMRQALPNFEASLAYEMLNFLGPDAAEGLAALQEKRRPDFSSRATGETGAPS